MKPDKPDPYITAIYLHCKEFLEEDTSDERKDQLLQYIENNYKYLGRLG